MPHQPWRVLRFSHDDDVEAVPGIASEPVGMGEDHLQLAVSPSFDALVDKVWSKELGVNEFMVELTEEASRSTGATGAALAIRSDQDDAVICRARFGETAPGLGSRLNTKFGISGECVRTGKLLCCNDTELDPRVDAQACRALGVRSIVAVPLCVQGAVGGILEVFSTSARAFSDFDIEKLKQLAHFATAATWCPADSAIAIPAPDPCAETANAVSSMTAEPSLKEESLPKEAYPNIETQPARNIVKSLYWVIAGGVAAIVLVLLNVFIWGHRSKTHQSLPQKAEVQPAQAQSLNEAVADGRVWLPPNTTTVTGEDKRELDTSETSTRFDRNTPLRKHSSMAKAHSRIEHQNDVRMRDFNAATAVVSQNGSDIENAPPSGDVLPPTEGSTFISGVLSIPSLLPAPPLKFQGITPGRLEHKVEPIYPPQARMARVDGAVRLRATVGTDGRVQEVRIISGNPLLVQAAVNAVRQWRYKPCELNNQPVAMQTDIVVTFRLR